MVKFLIHRPIAVTMTFLSVMLLGIVAIGHLPVSLLPDIDIPRVTVKVDGKGLSARQLESAVVKPLRQSLMQVSHLTDITSETYDESAIIKMYFEYGTPSDYVFIETNEKVDQSLNRLPEGVDRPRVIKASATDIPVFYLNLTLKNRENEFTLAITPDNSNDNKTANITDGGSANASSKFNELSDFAQQVIARRLEQLPEVALADVSGTTSREIIIEPDREKMASLNLSVNDIQRAIRENHLELGNLRIRDGRYTYDINVGNKLTGVEDIENVYINHKGKKMQVRDIATISLHATDREGLVLSNRQQAVSLAIIKQSDAKMGDLREAIKNLLRQFENDYPDIKFALSRDQTNLLDYAIGNLGQSLLLGAILAILVMFLFLWEWRSPLLIGITIPASLVLSMLFFHLLNISLNIISLSGLVLGVGMMIDNSIIVIDNIIQYRVRGKNLAQSCSTGVNEVFRPMLSSVLTTCAVFIPLVFAGGIGGALFYDQAIAVTIGLLVSLAVSVTLLPVYFKLIHQKKENKDRKSSKSHIAHNAYMEKMFKAYERVMFAVLRYQKTTWIIILVLATTGAFLFTGLKKERFPDMEKKDVLLRIDWNEPINLTENLQRINKLVAQCDSSLKHSTCFVGRQRFFLSNDMPDTRRETLVYLSFTSNNLLNKNLEVLKRYLQDHFPLSGYTFEEAENIFNQVFENEKGNLEVRLATTRDLSNRYNAKLKEILDSFRMALPDISLGSIVWEPQVVLKANPEKMALYNISYNNLKSTLQEAFHQNTVLTITGQNQSIPVVVGDEKDNLIDLLAKNQVTCNDGKRVYLNQVIDTDLSSDLKCIVAGQQGEYYPIRPEVDDSKVPETISVLKKELQTQDNFRASFTGAYFENRAMIKQLAMILIISILLLYFIMAAQFESLLLPIIILLEVPIDIAIVFIAFKLVGISINIMSLIGIVVMCGIVVNDSILKIDTINRLRNQGAGLIRAIAIGGHRRLKPIIMTSATTILALVPVLFFRGMGADLQKPLAVGVIAGLGVGTLVSLFFVPLCYYFLISMKDRMKEMRNERINK